MEEYYNVAGIQRYKLIFWLKREMWGISIDLESRRSFLWRLVRDSRGDRGDRK